MLGVTHGNGLPGDLSLRRDSQGLLPTTRHRARQWQRARATEDTSFQSMRLKQAHYNPIIMTDPDVQIVSRLYVAPANTASFSISMKPLSERKVSVDQWINRLRPKLARVPGATLFLAPVQDVPIGGRSGNAQFQYTLLGDNLQDLLAWAPLVRTEAASAPGDSGCE